jgi:transposase-like protein
VLFLRNALAHAGRSGRRVVAAFIATAFAQDHADAARAQWHQVADQVRPKLPKLAALLDDAEEGVLAYMAFPKEHRAKIHSIDKSFLGTGMLVVHGRPRGKERGRGWEPRRAA